MKPKHTPGPWYEASPGNPYQGLVIDEQTGANVAVVYDKTNARLIAASPRLANALARLSAEVEAILDYKPTDGDLGAAADEAKAALKEAGI